MHNVLFQIGPFTAYGYGLMIAVGILLGVMAAMQLAKQKGLDQDLMFSMALTGCIVGIIGAKLMYYIVEFPSILEDPSILLKFNEGFVVYGGLILGIASVFVYAKKKQVSALSYLDLGVIGIAIAQGFGRIGCFLAGCCYGRETDAWFGVIFPEGGLAPAGIKLIPTQLLSSAGDFLIAGILYIVGKKAKKKGTLCGLYLVLYAIGRFCIEFLRNDPRGNVGSLSTSQFIAIFMLAIGAGILFGAKKAQAK